jgi:hypothetical protein
MSPPSSSRRAARRSGICPTASASRSSKNCWPTSPRPSARKNSAASFSSSTMPDGMAKQDSQFLPACVSSFCRPTHQSSSLPNVCGRSSTNRSPTVATKSSPTSTPFSPIDAASSSTINRRSPKRQTSPGGQNLPNRSDQANPVSVRFRRSLQAQREAGRQNSASP